MNQRLLVWVVTSAAVVVTAFFWPEARNSVGNASAVIFSGNQRGCPIVIPSDAVPREREAADLLRAALAKAAGIPEGQFPIALERGAVPRRALFIGATRRGGDFMRVGRKAPFDTAVGLAVHDGAAFLRSENRESILTAIGWFLEKQLGAHWYMPGPLGEHIPRRAELALAPGDRIERPGFISRELGLGGSAEERAWLAQNRLEPRFEHGHNLVNIFEPEDLRRKPEMASMRNGAPYIPAQKGDYNWQPNLLSDAAVEHAATAAIRAFDGEPKRVSFSLSINDAIRYDDSHDTIAAVAPPRFFRHRPDYSNLVFRFTNAVAEQVAKRHPDRWLPAYAYYWCENTPGFPIAPNVVPFLTADRSQWSKPEFAAEDRALIERWCRAGAKIVGVYDYLEGAPYLCPRPMLIAVQEAIPFAFRAGVRAFYGEGQPNWALDGPKHWMAAQLLWSPERNPEELLELYFREYWAEAAGPMREFFALCERTWREESSPPLWLRYFEDEDQSWIFSATRLAELRRCLTEAAKLAQSAMVRRRVAFTSAGLGVTETFSDFCVARQRVSRMARPGANAADLIAAWKDYRAARTRFEQTFADTRRERPLAIAKPPELELVLRNSPDSRIARELARTTGGPTASSSATALFSEYVGVTAGEVSAVLQSGREVLVDAEWQQLKTQPIGGSNQFEWVSPGQVWQGSGEPWEGRRVQFHARGEGKRTLRISGARTEQIQQWASATPGAVYAAQVNVRAKASPGTATFLILSFIDENNQHIGRARVDRIPAGDEMQEIQLWVIDKAPPNARRVGVALRVLNQINDDFAEFSGASLRMKAD